MAEFVADDDIDVPGRGVLWVKQVIGFVRADPQAAYFAFHHVLWHWGEHYRVSAIVCDLFDQFPAVPGIGQGQVVERFPHFAFGCRSKHAATIAFRRTVRSVQCFPEPARVRATRFRIAA